MKYFVSFMFLVLLTQAAGAATADPADDDWLGEARALVDAVSLTKVAPGDPLAAHHQRWSQDVARTRGKWVDPARAFFPPLLPAGLPTKIVYPFGGGDLAGALVTYANATEITTLSLEAAGDVRLLSGHGHKELQGHALEPLLDKFREAYRWYLYNAHSKTTVMGSISGREVPGQILFWLAALAILDFEPVSLKYFKLGSKGEIAYIPRAQATPNSFDNAELCFRPRGHPEAPLVTYRHLRANLDDAHFGARTDLLAHLEAKGKVAAMTKAASFLLWSSEFSGIRDYLLGATDFMVSDATGVPPRIATAAGFTQTTYGKFTGPCLAADHGVSEAFKKLWASQPERPLPFRYGYPDAKRLNHMMITERQPKN